MTTPTTVQVRFQFRADTAANWTSINPTLLANELGRETDTGKIKIGNGSTAWNSLAYQGWSTLTYPLVNADIAAAAAISHSKLANITAGSVLLGNASNVPTATALSGDVTINSSGVTTIGSGVIVDADISATAEIAVSKLANGSANQILTTDGTNVSWTDSPTIAGNVIIEGNLTVNGTETIINVETLKVEDKNIEMGNVTTPTDLTADGGGITLKGTTDKTFNWVDSTDSWTSSENIDLANGKVIKINGTEVLSGTALGSNVLITSTNITDGTIVDADISGTAEIAVSKLADGAARQLLQTDSAGTGVEWTDNVDIPGTLDVTSTATFDGVISASAGAAATPSITFTGDLNTGLYSPGADQVAISTGGTGRLFIDSSGRLLVGTSTSVISDRSITPQIQLAGTNVSSTAISSVNYFSGGNAANLILGSSKGGTVGTQGLVDNGGTLGTISFTGSDGSAAVDAASISAQVDGTPGQTAGTFVAGTQYRILTTGTTDFTLIGAADSNPGTVFTATDVGTGTGTAIRTAGDMPGRLVFSTTADGSGNPTERMRLDSDGRLLVGLSSASSNAKTGSLTVKEQLFVSKGLCVYSGLTGPATLTTGTFVFTFKNLLINARVAMVKLSLSCRNGGVNTTTSSPCAEYQFQLFKTSGNVFTLNGATTIFEYGLSRATDFSFADLGSGVCTVTIDNPTAQNIAAQYKVEILSGESELSTYLDSVTVT